MSDEKANTNQAMVVASSRAIEPSSLRELHALANSAAQTGFFGAKSADQALIIMMAGRDMGFSYTQSLRAFQVIKGKPALSADAMVAVCLSRPDLCEYFRPVKMTETESIWITKRVGCDPVEGKFTIEDAKKAGILGDMYTKWPRRMLAARAKAFLARDVYPEILMGIYSPEEIKAEKATEDDVPPDEYESGPKLVVESVKREEPNAPTAPESAPAIEEKPAIDYDGRYAFFVEQLKAANEGDLKAIGDQIKEKMAGAPAPLTVKLRKAFSDRKASFAAPAVEEPQQVAS